MRGILAITYAFMLSYCPYQQIGFNRDVETYYNPTHTAFEIGLDLFDCVNFFAGEETYQSMHKSVISWNPYTQNYWLGVEYHKTFNEKLSLKAGYKHTCQHPLNCWDGQLSAYNYACSELYVGIEGKIDLF